MDDLRYLIKGFLYERQPPEEGQLDGTLYVCKGIINVYDDTKISKSIYPVYLIIERHRGRNNQIYYKLYSNTDKTTNGLINQKLKETYTIQYFIKPIGAINLIMGALQSENNSDFTIIIEGSSISSTIAHFNNFDFDERLAQTNMYVQNMLIQFENIDFTHHQYYNKRI
jgi:hypothetical protein